MLVSELKTKYETIQLVAYNEKKSRCFYNYKFKYFKTLKESKYKDCEVLIIDNDDINRITYLTIKEKE